MTEFSTHAELRPAHISTHELLLVIYLIPLSKQPLNGTVLPLSGV